VRKGKAVGLPKSSMLTVEERHRQLELQSTSAGEREVKQALRRTLLKYQLHKDQELFDKAYGYIREYY
jgi:hypothetical protein